MLAADVGDLLALGDEAADVGNVVTEQHGGSPFVGLATHG
jgi:hypothetical protein